MLKRVQSFDILKALSIFLVVFCHCSGFIGTIAENVFMTICFIGVPIFFMINGALLLNKPFDLKKHLKKTVNIYFVAVAWRLIYLVIGLVQSKNMGMFFDHTQETLSYLFLWTESSFANPAHMWFMKHLLAIYLIFPLIHLCFDKDKKNKNTAYFFLVVLFIVFIVCVEMNYFIYMLVKYFHLSIHIVPTDITSFMPYTKGQSIFYFVFGGVVWDYLKDEEWKKRFKIEYKHRILAGIVFLFSWFLMMVTKFWVDGTWSWNGTLYADGYSRIPTFLAVVSLSALFIDIDLNNKTIKTIFKVVSNSTLGIFYLHWCLLPIIEPVFTEIGLHINLLKTIIIVLVASVISWGLSHIPFLRKLVQ